MHNQLHPDDLAHALLAPVHKHTAVESCTQLGVQHITLYYSKARRCWQRLDHNWDPDFVNPSNAPVCWHKCKQQYYPSSVCAAVVQGTESQGHKQHTYSQTTQQRTLQS
jgi:hypothetical protein